MNAFINGITIWEYVLIQFGSLYLIYYLYKEKLISVSMLFWALIIAIIPTYLGLVSNDSIIADAHHFNELLYEVAIKVPGAISYKYLLLDYFFYVVALICGFGLAKRSLQLMKKRNLRNSVSKV